MRRLCLFAAALILVSCSPPQQKAKKPDGFKEITFETADQRTVYADFYPALEPNSEKVILMFHQANSNAGEYEGPALTAITLGYNCIALDQRAGGEMWGRTNRTTTKGGTGEYMDAYKDMEAALDYCHTHNYTTILVWGSSYSASLAFKLATEDSTIKAVIAFSPGEYLEDPHIVKSWAQKTTVPTFFACTEGELGDGRQDLFNALHTDKKVLACFNGGVHGTSTLLPEKSEAAGKYMEQLKLFITGLKKE